MQHNALAGPLVIGAAARQRRHQLPQGIASVPDAKMIAVANGQGTGLQVIDAGDYRFAKGDFAR